MSNSSNQKKIDEISISIEEVKINPKIFERESLSLEKSKNYRQIKNYKRFHQKIKSAQNPLSKYKDNKNLFNNQTHQSQTISSTTMGTPKIEEIQTRYQSTIRKLDSNIFNLKQKYKNLISETFKQNKELEQKKMRFIQLKKKEEKKKEKDIKQNFEFIKKMKIKQAIEKNQKIKQEIKENKKKEIIKKKEEVQKLKKKEKENFINHKNKLLISQLLKKKIIEQEKKFIHDKLILQKDKNINERKKREMIRKQNEFKNAERIQASKAFNLIKNQKELESKIRIQDSINNKLNKQIIKFVITSCNDDCVKN